MARPSIVPGLTLEDALRQASQAMALLIVEDHRHQLTEDEVRAAVLELMPRMAELANLHDARPWDKFCAHIVAKQRTNPEQAQRWIGSLVSRVTREALRLSGLRAEVRRERRQLAALAA